MTPAELIAAFDVLAEAPDGVKRCGSWCCRLAVRGRLVPQNPQDEPASIPVPNRKGSGRNPLKSSDELLLELPVPQNWRAVTLQELCDKIGAGARR